MTDERAKSLATDWSFGFVCSLREGEAVEYHKLMLKLLQEREERRKASRCPNCYWRAVGRYQKCATCGENENLGTRYVPKGVYNG